MWKYTSWKQAVKIAVSVFFGVMVLASFSPDRSNNTAVDVSHSLEDVDSSTEDNIDVSADAGSSQAETESSLEREFLPEAATGDSLPVESSLDDVAGDVSQAIEVRENISSSPEIEFTVYYTRTGTKYHYRNPCGNGTYYPCTLEQALARGLEPCSKCT